ncbi:hypothetical protein J6590_065456 [Homalodisca vitripennis]|nr:hypothetical protein J6590_065456 [Homalodisca vitripennis]
MSSTFHPTPTASLQVKASLVLGNGSDPMTTTLRGRGSHALELGRPTRLNMGDESHTSSMLDDDKSPVRQNQQTVVLAQMSKPMALHMNACKQPAYSMIPIH